jgi:branched-chain amino acid transport system substrate-binding protein
VAVASVAVLPLLATACQAGGSPPDRSAIVIGADLELSGVNAPIGNTYVRALRLRIDQLNSQGGVNGRHIDLDARDNRSDPSVSVANVNTFAANRAVAGVIMGACSGCLNRVAKVIEDAHLPTVSLAPATAVARPVTDRQYVFKLGPNAQDSAAALATELRRAGVRKVALLATDDVDGTDALSAMSAHIAGTNASVVGQQLFRATDSDVTQPVRAALGRNPDALVVSAFPAQATLVAKSARDAGYTKTIFFDAAAAGDLFLSGPTAGATDGTVMVAPQSLVIDDIIATSPAKTARKRWFEEYTSRFGTFSGYSTYAADAVRMILDAVRTAGGIAHRKMRDIMENTAFDGLCGQIRFTRDNHSGMGPQALTTVVARAGRWRLLG